MSKKDEVETSVERADPLVGTIFDKRFRVDERIAVGGFGAIYRATHVKSGHPIALKVLLPVLAQDLGVVARFRREGDTLTALRNPHTITAYELGQAADRTLFITMELLHGESLFERYKANGPFEWKRMVKIAREVCESLEEAHAMGIVHRDLKPTNIHLEKHGDDPDYVKVLDFGIAKILRGSDFDASDITNAGQMIGTIDYMSPEQMVGGTVTGQSDIYTLGIVMYEMIAGTTPFPESLTAAQALAAVMKTKPEPLYLRAPVPEELDRIVMRCLERDTSRRYATVKELRMDLSRLLAGIVPSRASAIETKPIERHDDEATEFTPPPVRRAKRPSGEDTTFTPPPEPLLAQTRRAEWSTSESTALIPPSQQLLADSRRAKRESVEETTFTPPPEPLLAQARRAKRPSVEDTSFTPPPEALLAQARRAKRPSVEDTAFTPPPAGVLDELRTPPGGGHAPEWTDEDEYAGTAPRLRAHATGKGEHAAKPPRTRASAQPAGDEHERVTAVARLADIVERAAMTRGSAIERAATIPRGDASERAATVPRAERKPTTAPPPIPSAARKPPSAPPPVPAQPRSGSQPRALSSQLAAPAVPRTLTPSQNPSNAPALSRTMTPSTAPVRQTPVPQLVAAPFSSRPVAPSSPSSPTDAMEHPPGAAPHAAPQGFAPNMPPHVPTPAGIAPYTPNMPPHVPTPAGIAPYTPDVPTPGGLSPYPLAPQHAPNGFDMGRMTAREATIRRLIWIVVIVVGLGIGAILATQL